MRIDHLFRRNRPTVELAGLQKRLASAVVLWAGRTPDPDLVRARLADGCRDAEIDPPLPEDFDGMVSGLDDEGWRRLAVLTVALEQRDVRAALTALVAVRTPLELIRRGFVVVALKTPLLTLELLSRGSLRVEELARKLLAGLGAGVSGESARTSDEQLDRLDYERLLAEAAAAEKAAEQRLEELKKLQDEKEAKRPGRGKW
jgi:hypothetical protein